MRRNPLLAAWIALLILSAASTVLAATIARAHVQGSIAAITGAGLLILAGAKARVILSRYLGLAAAPFWQRGFAWALSAYLMLLLALYALPSL